MSGLNEAIEAVNGKGSDLMVTDSKATARVLVAWLRRIGFLLVAAAAAENKNRQVNKEEKHFAANHRKRVFIGKGSVAISERLFSGEILQLRGKATIAMFLDEGNGKMV